MVFFLCLAFSSYSTKNTLDLCPASTKFETDYQFSGVPVLFLNWQANSVSSIAKSLISGHALTRTEKPCSNSRLVVACQWPQQLTAASSLSEISISFHTKLQATQIYAFQHNACQPSGMWCIMVLAWHFWQAFFLHSFISNIDMKNCFYGANKNCVASGFVHLR